MYPPSKRGQTALEYLMIIVVSLVLVVAVMIFTQGTTDDLKESQTENVNTFLDPRGNVTLCTPGDTLPCFHQDGVCAGSLDKCVSGRWLGCDYTDMSGYEENETSCDSLDNDCDGYVDVGCTFDYYCDADVDGYNSSSVTGNGDPIPPSCNPNPGTDCDDSNVDINPDETENCTNSIDDECDGDADCDDTDCVTDPVCGGGPGSTCPEAGCCCDSCESCNTLLQGTCTAVYLEDDLLYDSPGGGDDACIEMDTSSSSKTFDCQDNSIIGIDVSTYGIFLANTDDATIKSCEISHFYYGILVDMDSDGNTLDSNDVMNNNIGVVFDSGSDNNLIRDSKVCSSEWGDLWNSEDGPGGQPPNLGNSGIGTWCDDYAEAARNSINDSNLHEYCAYDCAGNPREVCPEEGCCCDSCESCEALLAEDNSCTTVYLSEDIIATDEDCITIQSPDHADGKTLDCQGNTIGFSGSIGNHHGASISTKDDFTITDCVVEDFPQYGIEYVACTNSLITNNVLRDNAISIGLNFAGPNEVSGNTIEGSTANAIQLFSTVGHLIDDNIITGGSTNAISLNNVDSTIISNNEITGNSDEGIVLTGSDCSDNTINNNVIRANGGYGISHNVGSNNVISLNTIENNDYHGVALHAGTSNTDLSNNYICNNYLADPNYKDIIYNGLGTNTGDDNTCDTVSNWNDDGTTDCTYTC